LVRLEEGDIITFSNTIRFTVECTDDDNQKKIDEALESIQGLDVSPILHSFLTFYLQLNDKTLHLRARYFINEGKFFFAEKKGECGCRVLLFDDMVLWAKETKKNVFTYKGHFPMKCMRVTDTDGNCALEKNTHFFEEVPCGLKLSNRISGEVITLRATTDEAKRLWVKEIKRIVNEWVKNNINEMKCKLFQRLSV
jgi:hypothetical protein